MNPNDIFKDLILEYIKAHNESEGKLVEAFNHIQEAQKILNSLPQNIQRDVWELITQALAHSGWHYNK